MPNFKITAQYKGDISQRTVHRIMDTKEQAEKWFLDNYGNIAGFEKIISCKEVAENLRAKNYMVIITTGKAAYSTSVRAYKVIKNTNVFIGEMHGLSQMETAAGYLEKVVKDKGSKIPIRKLWSSGKINVQEIRV